MGVERMTWVKRTLVIVGLLLLPIAALVGTLVWLFVAFVPTADLPQPADDREAYLQGLTFLEGYADYEKALQDPERRRSFLSAVEEAKKDLAWMTSGRFEAVVARAVAQTDNGGATAEHLEPPAAQPEREAITSAAPVT